MKPPSALTHSHPHIYCFVTHHKFSKDILVHQNWLQSIAKGILEKSKPLTEFYSWYEFIKDMLKIDTTTLSFSVTRKKQAKIQIFTLGITIFLWQRRGFDSAVGQFPKCSVYTILSAWHEHSIHERVKWKKETKHNQRCGDAGKLNGWYPTSLWVILMIP